MTKREWDNWRDGMQEKLDALGRPIEEARSFLMTAPPVDDLFDRFFGAKAVGQANDLNCDTKGPLGTNIHKRLAYVSGAPGYTIASGKALTYRCMLCGAEVHLEESDY